MSGRLELALVLALALACTDGESAGAGAGGSRSTSGYSSTVQLRSEASIPAGELRGEVRFSGAPPARRPLPMGAGSGCGGEAPLSDALIVVDGAVVNVLVHAREGPATTDVAPPPSAPIVLDQENCVYSPHVVALRAGQLLEIRTSDGVTHNVHARPKRNDGFNLSQTPAAPAIEERFERGELSIPIACDIHPWMSAVVHVLEHDAFALTGPDGSFAIRGLPPGRHRFEALHEALGKAEFEVELDGRAGVFVTVEFARAGPSAH